MPDFSIICVFNDPDILESFLKEGLEQQSHRGFEEVLIDNRDGRYPSAASALNAGAAEAGGRYLVFVHQDVKLPPHYLAEARAFLDDVDALGVAGAAGVRSTGSCSAQGVNVIQHGPERRDWERGTGISEPTEVDALDELLLIVPRDVFRRQPFSATLCRGWHLYGVEYSLRMKEAGRSVLVLPLGLWHRSAGGWRDWRHDLTLYRLIRAYPHVDCIHTTGGSWPATRRYVAWRLLNKSSAVRLAVHLVRSFRQDGTVSTLRKVYGKIRRTS